jgi:hypothetical protein
MKTSDLLAQLRAEEAPVGQVCCGIDDEEEADGAEGTEDFFDEDDFWEAVDLLETSKKMLAIIIRRETIGPARRHLIENHINDIGVFCSQFIVESKS